MIETLQTAGREAIVDSLVNGTHHGGTVGGYCSRRIAGLARANQRKLDKTLRVLTEHGQWTGRILRFLSVNNGEATYDELSDAFPISKNWVKQLVGKLRSTGIIVTPGNPATVRFSSWSVSLVVKELLSVLYEDWAELSKTTAPFMEKRNTRSGSVEEQLEKNYVPDWVTEPPGGQPAAGPPP